MKNELKQENIGKFIVDREVNHPEKRHPCRLYWLTRVYLNLLNLFLSALCFLNPFSRCPLF